MHQHQHVGRAEHIGGHTGSMRVQTGNFYRSAGPQHVGHGK